MNRLRLGGQVAAVTLVVALLAILTWKIMQRGSELTADLNRGGTPDAPMFSLGRLKGTGELSLASLRGKTVVVNFWASYCGPCRDETPILQRSWRKWQDRGVVFVGVDVLDFREDARAFMRRYGVTYPNVYDGKGWTVGRYGVTGYPETYFIDGQGRVRHRIVGAIRDIADLDAGIRLARLPA